MNSSRRRCVRDARSRRRDRARVFTGARAVGGVGARGGVGTGGGYFLSSRKRANARGRGRDRGVSVMIHPRAAIVRIGFVRPGTGRDCERGALEMAVGERGAGDDATHRG